MCDFSLHTVRSRPAKVGDRLTTHMFNLGTSGFCAPEDERMAVCCLGLRSPSRTKLGEHLGSHGARG
jgi:hypothetical protein